MAERCRTGLEMLEFDSFNALSNEPSASNQTIRLVSDLTAAEISGSNRQRCGESAGVECMVARLEAAPHRQHERTPSWSLYRRSHRSPASAIRVDQDGAGYPRRDRRAAIAATRRTAFKTRILYPAAHAYDRFPWQHGGAARGARCPMAGQSDRRGGPVW
jgi:hypothetical protein